MHHREEMLGPSRRGRDGIGNPILTRNATRSTLFRLQIESRLRIATSTRDATLIRLKYFARHRRRGVHHERCFCEKATAEETACFSREEAGIICEVNAGHIVTSSLESATPLHGTAQCRTRLVPSEGFVLFVAFAKWTKGRGNENGCTVVM